MAGRDIITIGASAGGVEALKQLVQGLPADLPAALFVVLHMPSHTPSVLPRILSRAGPLPAVHPADQEPIKPGMIYIAPPDFHLLVKPGLIRLSRGPRENCHRPSADATFRTAARAYGARVLGVVLSGMLDDGTAGLSVIKRQGGLAIVQDPEDALYASMPRNAIDNVAVDHVLAVAGIPALLARLVRETPTPSAHPPDGDLGMEADMAALDPEAVHDPDRVGIPAPFACPECHGTLWEVRDGDLLRFRCRVGHAYSAESLFAEQSDALEAALWTALRALEERAALASRMEQRARARGHDRIAGNFAEQFRDTIRNAEVIRRILVRDQPLTTSNSGVAS